MIDFQKPWGVVSFLPGFCRACPESAPFLVGCSPSPFGRATTGRPIYPTGPACCQSRRRTSPSRSGTERAINIINERDVEGNQIDRPPPPQQTTTTTIGKKTKSCRIEIDKKKRGRSDLLCETRPGFYPDALGVDPPRSGPCRILAESFPAAAAICPACFDTVPALRALSPRRRRPCPARRAGATRCPDTVRILPAKREKQICGDRN